MNTFTALHVAGTTPWVTTVDPVVLSLAAGLFLLVAALIWLPAPSRPGGPLLRRRTRRHILSLAVGATVFLAVMPIVLPWDHLFLSHGDETAAEESVHASHCHESPGTCSDAPVTAGPGQLMLTAPLLPTPALFGMLLLFAVPLLAGITLRPETRPPLALQTRSI
jgi:hypothetical protein